MKLKFLLSVFGLFAFSVSSSAQGGSNYSALGIGDMRRSVGGLYDAMAGTCIAMPTGYGINVVNPALLGVATTTRLQAGYRFNQHMISSGDASSWQNNGKIDGLIAMFSVDTSMGFGFTLGMLPYSSLNYTTSRELRTDYDDGTVTGRSTQLGKGGSSQLQIGASVRLLDELQIGVSFAGLFGVLTYSDEVALNGNYFAVASTQSYDIRGILFRGGVWWKPTPWLNLGAFASGGTNASVYITRTATGVNAAGVYYDTSQIESSESGLPIQAGLGIGIRTGKNMVGADISYGDYTSMTVNVRPDAQYSTSLKASIGYTHPGDMGNISTFFEKIGYHFGASIEKLYVTYNGMDLHEYMGAGGISFPLGGNAMVDAGIQLGWRGPGIDNYLTEFVGRLTVSVSIGETWFKPFGRE